MVKKLATAADVVGLIPAQGEQRQVYNEYYLCLFVLVWKFSFLLYLCINYEMNTKSLSGLHIKVNLSYLMDYERICIACEWIYNYNRLT